MLRAYNDPSNPNGGEPNGGTMPVQNAGGAVAQIPRPQTSPAGIRLRAPMRLTPMSPGAGIGAPTGTAPAPGAMPPRLSPGDPSLAPHPTSPTPAAGMPSGLQLNDATPSIPLNGPTMPNASGALPPAPAGITPPGTTAVSGSEVPYHVGTAPSSVVTDTMSSLGTEAQRELAQPTVYDDPLYQQAKAAGARGIQENYDNADEALRGELASRGLDYSSVAGKSYTTLGNRKAAALSDLDTNILRERASALAAGRTAAFNNARSYAGDQNALEAQGRSEQRGERAYTDQLRGTAQQQAISQDDRLQQILNTALGYGSSPTGSSILQGAGSLYGYGAGQYGNLAQGGNEDLAALAQEIAKYFGGTG